MARHFTTVPAARRCERHAIPDFHSCLSRRLSSGRGADGAPRCGRNRPRYSIHDATEQFEARGIDPLRVLENHQHWIFAR